MLAQLWEWTVDRHPRNHPVGICGTEQRAMHALSKALIATGGPATGHITPMTLIRPMYTDPTYLRQPPQRTAVYDGTAIQWHRSNERSRTHLPGLLRQPRGNQ